MMELIVGRWVDQKWLHKRELMKSIKKTIFLLDINNYASELTKITRPYVKKYADRIGADIHIINKRKWPDMPIVYEKLQIKDLAKELQSDWNIYIDSDALIHPETPDFTNFIKKDTVLHNGADMAAIRWIYDEYFLRDGRDIGSCNWLTIASDWCLDLWTPLDISLEQALKNIQPTMEELRSNVIEKDHLIDDYTLSRNIARYGLKFETILDLSNRIGLQDSEFFWHLYTIPIEEKVSQMKETLERWKLPDGYNNL